MPEPTVDPEPPRGRSPEPGEQQMLPGLVRAEAERGRKAAATRARKAAAAPIATENPVATVLVDLPLAHLDRPFEYSVPESMAESARPGVRVKVRFAGQDVDGFLIERRATAEHTGSLSPLRRVVSDEPILSPAIAALCQALAHRYAGTRADVLRLAIPPRHAGTEKESSPEPVPARVDLAAGAQAWEGYDAAPAYLTHLAQSGTPRAVWSAAPGADWPNLVAHAVAATRAAGRGAVVCVPDRRDLARADAAMAAVLGPDQHVTLSAEAGPAQRYRDFLSVSRGTRRVVLGPRAAAFAPVHDLGLVVMWDDGDDLFAEPRAPYPHSRDTLLTRAELEGTALLLGGFARSVEAQRLVATGWAKPLEMPKSVIRQRVQVSVAGAHEFALERDPWARTARFPQEAHAAIRAGLTSGPVLVQTPRAGYVGALACTACRTRAQCAQCRGPLALMSATSPPACSWCGSVETAWSCRECGERGLRAPVVGEARTAEELGRVFPGVPVRSSAGDRVLAAVDAAPAIVVATPGAEPVAASGYAAVVLLDTWSPLGAPHLRAAEEALRRWSNAAGLVAPGGRVVAVGDPAEPALQALVRWDHAGFAEREAAARQEARLPPAARVATVRGELGAVDDVLTLVRLPEGGEVLGPAPWTEAGGDDDVVQAVIRVPRSRGEELVMALGEVQRVRSARKLDPVRIQVDPPTL